MTNPIQRPVVRRWEESDESPFRIVFVYPREQSMVFPAPHEIVEVGNQLEQRIVDLEQRIADGRCCDDADRLLDCGHPPCVMSEVCEICVEIGDATGVLEQRIEGLERELAEARAKLAVGLPTSLCESHWQCPECRVAEAAHVVQVQQERDTALREKVEAETRSVPGMKGQHAIITPTCRVNRGNFGAFDEAVRRLRGEYEACLVYRGEDGAKYHLVLFVEVTS